MGLAPWVTFAADAPGPAAQPLPEAAMLVPLHSVRLLPGPFSPAIVANRTYLLAHDPDRLLAPFLREAGLSPRAKTYGNWESTGLDGHTAGHYLSALASMIDSGADTPDGELRRRLDYMVTELARCQASAGDGYLGGVPGGHVMWREVAAGRIDANGFGINGKWVPWYNLHKSFAGLRDAWVVAGNQQARDVLVRYGDWCIELMAGLNDEQMQTMLKAEHGGMNEVLADLFAITGDEKYLQAARRFSHREILDPLRRHEDRLTGRHANTQIPKVIGLARIAGLSGDREDAAGARFFWETVVRRRTVAFGGNSVSEHFNDPSNFQSMIEHREGPETCNTYNMLRLTERLFAAEPRAEYADYYERALFNHILASINPERPGYVYFTPIRPAHYRVYSQPEQAFWCCVGSGMENPGKYGEFIYARAADGGVYVNLFIASELTLGEGRALRQTTTFPDEPRTRFEWRLAQPTRLAMRIRHPAWVAADDFSVRVNGETIAVNSSPSSYATIERLWRDGDVVEVDLPMRTSVERLPDGSDWVAFLRGPIVLAAPSGQENLVGLRADDTRMGHVAHGPLVPLDRIPTLVTEERPDQVGLHVMPDPDGAPLHFRLRDIAVPAAADGLPLVPFFRLHDARYQMYWQVSTPAGLAARRERVAAEERARAALAAATLDLVAIGEQQPEVEHGFVGEGTESGEFQSRRWRHGRSFQYTLDRRGETAVELSVTYSGGDRDRVFDVLANGVVLATERPDGARPGEFIEKRYVLPPAVLAGAPGGRVTVRFAGRDGSLAGGIFDLRLVRSAGVVDER